MPIKDDIMIKDLFLTFASSAFLLWAVCYVFLGIGLYVMAKRRKVSYAWLAFVPIASTYLLGKLVGEINFFGLKIKHLGLYATIAEVVSVALLIGTDLFYLDLIGETWNFHAVIDGKIIEDTFNTIYGLTNKETGEIIQNGMIAELARGARLVYVLAEIALYVDMLVQFVLMIFLFRNYAPKSAFLLSILALVLDPIAGPVIIFAIRKNSWMEYRDYMKMKAQSMFGGGNPYQYGDGRYRDPYDFKPKDAPKADENKPESPFGEYDNKN